MTSPSGGRADALACYRAALEAVEPARLVRARLTREGAALVLGGSSRARHQGPVLIVSAGKAALAMARAAAAVAGGACTGGLVVVPHGGSSPSLAGFEVLEAGHPVPDAASEAAASRVLAGVAAAGAGTLVLVLLSGGASALLAAPAPGLTLADKQAVTTALLAAGVDIASVNTVRKHLSRIKGGGLARAAAGAAALWTLVLSDVVGDDPGTIASGPTVADPTTFADAMRVLSRAVARPPAAVRAHLERGSAGAVPETAKPGDPDLERAHTAIVGGNRDAVLAAAETARRLGYAIEIVADPIAGDAAAAGRALTARLRAAPRDRPVGVIGGGETTVRVVPGGRGGRCQHLALAAAIALEDDAGVLLAAGTDGVDGPTRAAGACVDGGTVARARSHGLDPVQALAATDSHTLLAASGDLVETGPTGTNVADVVVALRPAC